jgi:hypothetical protein
VERPKERPFSGREKWGAVVAHLVLAGLGTALAWAAVVAVPADVVAVQVLIAYTAAGVLATLGLAAATAATSRLPTLRQSSFEGSPAVVARSWSGEWWYDQVMDAGLAAVSWVLVGLALGAGTDWAVASIPVALLGAYFTGRVVLLVTGRRRNEALWLTTDEVVHETSWGVERVRREQVRRVARVGGTTYLALEVEGPVQVRPCPRLWRRRGAGPRPGQILVHCSRMGHDASDLAGWLGSEIGVPAPRR